MAAVNSSNHRQRGDRRPSSMAPTRKPHEVLARIADGTVTVRVLRPNATSVDLMLGGERIPMAHVHRGVWAAAVPGDDVPDYRLSVAYDGDPLPMTPTDSCPPGEVDQHLISGAVTNRSGRSWVHPCLMNHPRTRSRGLICRPGHPMQRCPRCRRLQLLGWHRSSMRSLGSTGIWEIFVPEIGDGAVTSSTSSGMTVLRRLKGRPVRKRHGDSTRNRVRGSRLTMSGTTRRDDHAAPRERDPHGTDEHLRNCTSRRGSQG